MFRQWLTFSSFLTFSVAGCYSSATPTIGEDTERPRIVRHLPTDNETGVATSTPVAVRFSKNMELDRTYATTASWIPLTVIRAGDREPVAFRELRYDPIEFTLTFQPTVPLTPNTDYEVRVDGALADVNGNPLIGMNPDQSTTWLFTTLAERPMRQWSNATATNPLRPYGVFANDVGDFLLAGAIDSPFTSTIQVFNGQTRTLDALDMPTLPFVNGNSAIILDAGLNRQKSVCLLQAVSNAARNGFELHASIRRGNRWSNLTHVGDIGEINVGLYKVAWDSAQQCHVFWVSDGKIFSTIGSETFASGAATFVGAHTAINNDRTEGPVGFLSRQFDVAVVAPGQLRVVYYVGTQGSGRHQVYSKDYLANGGWQASVRVADIGAESDNVIQSINTAGNSVAVWTKHISTDRTGTYNSELWYSTKVSGDAAWSSAQRVTSTSPLLRYPRINAVNLADSGEINVQYYVLGDAPNNNPTNYVHQVVTRNRMGVWQSPTQIDRSYEVYQSSFDRAGNGHLIVSAPGPMGSHQIIDLFKLQNETAYRQLPNQPALWDYSSVTTPYFYSAIDREGRAFAVFSRSVPDTELETSYRSLQ